VASTERSTGKGAGVLLPVDDHPPVHVNILDAHRVLLRVLFGGMGLRRIGVEYHDVRLESAFRRAPVGVLFRDTRKRL